MRRLIAGGCLLALTVACAHAPASPALGAVGVPQTAPPAPVATLPAPLKPPLTSPFAAVENGDVQALVPKRWEATPLETDPLRQGLVASPNPKDWRHLDGSVPGLEVAWVDVTRVGIPTDLYYLAASGPAIPPLASSHTCRRDHVSVLLNHRPLAGDPNSPGDYVERGTGTCHKRGHIATRWEYFVAAPGFGPLRQMGIPTSGLYLAVAVVPQSPNAEQRLDTILRSAQYGSASIAELMRAARESANLA
ncbi:MAG TPA: hypothetical protein VID47_04640 [Actinomycetota bacterium]